MKHLEQYNVQSPKPVGLRYNNNIFSSMAVASPQASISPSHIEVKEIPTERVKNEA